MKRIKKIIGFILSMAMIVSCMTGLVFADEAETPEQIVLSDDLIKVEQDAVLDSDDANDNDELLLTFLMTSVSVSHEAADSFAAGNHLNGVDQKIYNLIRKQAEKIASGEITSTKITLSLKDMDLDEKVFFASDLGVDSIIVDGAISQEAVNKLGGTVFDLDRIVSALLFDCPEEFYWYEKTVGCKTDSYGIGAKQVNGEYGLFISTDITFKFTVAQDYAIKNASGTYEVDGNTIILINTAIDRAKAIVADHADETDFQKVVSYKDEICNAVTYNSAAGNHQYTYAYGNPWQLIWVFDNDPDTNVVCEGYSKAFQFLCDTSEFRNSNVESKLVSGTMSGGTGAGAHMWNIVTMDDGKNYLVDVTNCDSGSVGYPDKLFLVGDDNGSVAAGYSIAVQGQRTISYYYGETTLKVYSEEELTLAGADYENQPLAFTYSLLPDGTAEITGYNGSDVILSIPAEIDGYLVTAIGESAFSAHTNVTEVTIPDSVTSIGAYAFLECESITTVNYSGDYESWKAITVGDGNEYLVRRIECSFGHHQWGEWEVIIQATEETEGLEKRVCRNDASHEETRVIPVPGHTHTLKKVEKEDATCTTDGHEEYWKCSDCDRTFSDEHGETPVELEDLVIPKGHKWETEYTIDKEATCKEEGSKSIHCSVCGETKPDSTQIIKKTEHSYSDWKVTKTATTKEKGEESRTCSLCGEVETRSIPALKQAFEDVQDPTAWFYNTVYSIAGTKNTKGSALMSGYGDGKNFGPADPLTRQDFAVILYRVENEPEIKSTRNPFPDADSNGYYYTSILWAKNNKVITGYDNGKFGVGDNITREQVATILYRYAKDYLHQDTSVASKKGNLKKFKDYKSVSAFATDALAWANGAGVITGKDNGTKIDPQGNAARAEIGAMILRFIDYMSDISK